MVTKTVKVLGPIIFLALILTGCNIGSKSAQDVIAQATKAANNLKSFQADMSGTILSESGQDKANIDIKSTSEMRTKPMVSHLTMNMKNNTIGQTIKMEMYLNKNQEFIKISTLPNWIKMDTKAQGINIDQQNKNTDPTQGLKLLKKYADKLSMTKTDAGYQMHMEMKDGKFGDLLKEYLASNVSSSQSAKMQSTLDKINIQKVNYTYVVDAKTYQPKSFKMSLDATVDVGSGKTTKISETIQCDYSKINQLNNLSIPKDIVTKAVDMPKNQTGQN